LGECPLVEFGPELGAALEPIAGGAGRFSLADGAAGSEGGFAAEEVFGAASGAGDGGGGPVGAVDHFGWLAGMLETK